MIESVDNLSYLGCRIFWECFSPGLPRTFSLSYFCNNIRTYRLNKFDFTSASDIPGTFSSNHLVGSLSILIVFFLILVISYFQIKSI